MTHSDPVSTFTGQLAPGETEDPMLPATDELGSALARAKPLELDANPVALYLATQNEGSRATHISGLRRIVQDFFRLPDVEPGDFPWHDLRYLHTQAMRTWLAERYAPATANRILSAVRGILRQAYRLELLDRKSYELATDIPCVRGERLPAGRSLSQGERLAVFTRCDLSTPIGARNAAAVAILYGGGLRRAEVCALDVADLRREESSVRVQGKGNKHRIVYLPAGAWRAIDAWLGHRGDWAGPLILPFNGRGQRPARRRMRRDSLSRLMTRLAAQSGVKGFSPHDLRRSYVGDLLDAGADLVTVSKLVGHAQLSTTARYDRRGERAKRSASELIHVPIGDDG